MREGQSGRYAERIERALQRLQSGIAAGKTPSLSELAQEAAMSEYHFHRVFRLMTGETVGAAATRLRLAGSLPALRRDGIRQAADHSGYASSQAYSRALRAQAGVAPGELQRDATRFDEVAEALSKPADDGAALRIEIVALEPLRLLAIRNVGDYAELDLAYTRLFEIVCAQMEPDAIRGIYGVPHDDPRDVPAAQCRIDCALDTGAQGQAAGELVELNLAGGAHARMFHHGDYDRIHAAIDALYDWAIANDRDIAARPLFVHYCDDPEQTPVEALRAEIFLPLLEEKA